VPRPLREVMTPKEQTTTPPPTAAQAANGPLTNELAPALSVPAALEKVGTGTLGVVSEDTSGKTYGRAITVADKLSDERVIIAKWIRRLTNWNVRQAPMQLWREKIAPLVEQRLAEKKTPVLGYIDYDQ